MAEGTFTVLKAKRAGRPAVLVIDAGLDADGLSVAYPWLVTITLAIAEPNDEGLCDADESERLGRLEDQLLDAIGAEEYAYAGRITWNGSRQILVYVAYPNDVVTRLRVLAADSRPPIVLDVEHEPQWSTYRQFAV